MTVNELKCLKPGTPLKIDSAKFDMAEFEDVVDGFCKMSVYIPAYQVHWPAPAVFDSADKSSLCIPKEDLPF